MAGNAEPFKHCPGLIKIITYYVSFFLKKLDCSCATYTLTNMSSTKAQFDNCL